MAPELGTGYPWNYGDPRNDLESEGLPGFPPDLLREHAREVLVGRAGELARMDALAASAHAGEGGRLLLVGDPGIGRSALLDALHRRAARRGLQVLRVQPEEDRDSLTAWNVLVGSSPTLLLVDDAHLVDVQALDNLRTAIERLGQSPLAAVVAITPDPVLQQHFPHWPRLRLEPLDREAARAVLRASLGHGSVSPIPDHVIEAMHGNPQALVAADDLLSEDQLAGRAPLPDPMPVPTALMSGWARTLDRLGQHAQDALLDVAISGGRLDLLSAMADSPEALAEGLDETVQSGLLILGPEGHPSFRSPTVRDVVLSRTPAALRRRAHRRAAAAARRLELPPGLIVDHLALSVITADDAIAAQIAAEAERAEQMEHFAVAARAWEAAARMTTVPSDRVAFALSAIRVSFDMGLPASEDLLETVAGHAPDPRSALHIAGIRAEQRADLDPDAALPAILRQVELAGLTSPDLIPTLLLDVVGIALQSGDTQAALNAAQRYAQLDRTGLTYRQRPDPPWSSTAALAAALFQDGQVARAMPLRREAIEAAGASDPRAMDLPMLMSTIGLDDLLLDISPEATDRLLVAAERASGDSGLLPCLYGIQGWRAKARGDWQTARAFLTVGRPQAEEAGLVQPWLGMTALSVELAAQCGEEEILRVDAGRLREVGSRCGNRRRLATLDRALGLRALVDGRLGEAVTWLSSAADVGFLGRGLRDAILPARVDLIEALVRSGDLAAAAERYAQVHGLLVDMGDPLATALDERAAALVTGGSEAEGHFREALASHGRDGEPFEEARTLLMLGEHLRRERRQTEARALLQSAVHTFDRLGAAPWSAKAGQELRAAGGQVTVDAAITPLTPQERAVALAVASGMSNREVAEALFLSTRTVEYHLGNVYRKLGVHGRGALGRAIDSASAPSPASAPASSASPAAWN